MCAGVSGPYLLGGDPVDTGLSPEPVDEHIEGEVVEDDVFVAVSRPDHDSWLETVDFLHTALPQSA